MKIKRIRLYGFMGHEDTNLELPDVGLIVVTGPNGAGKSSLIEGVAVGGWNKTLRGKPPWMDGTAGGVELETYDGLVIKRTRSAGGKGALHVEGGPTYETATKAQEALDTRLWAFDLWRQACVFSSADADNFTGATDADRKRLLENVLGLACFDPALKSCRDDLRKAEQRLGGHQSRLGQVEAELAAERRRVADAQRSVETLKVEALPEGTADRVGALTDELEELRRKTSELERRAREASTGKGSRVAKVDELKRRLDKLAGDVCFTCGQSIGEEVRAKLRTELDVAHAETARAVQAAVAEADAAEAELTKVRTRKDAVAQERTELTTVVSGARRAEAALAEARKTLAAAKGSVDGLVDQLLDAEAAVGEAQMVVDELLAVERVLGTKGVRAHVLGSALGGLEVMANDRLVRIAGEGMSVRISASRPKVDGTAADEVFMEVLGAGGGYGYQASSGGERRGIDVSVMLALAGLAEAAHGVSGGTLFCDEVFDALDAQRRAAVVSLLAEVAQERAVLVITHNEDLAARLPAALRCRVEGGRLAVG